MRRLVVGRADNRCECCGKEGGIEVHERWEYREKERLQKLKRLVALCSKCHEATHMGLAQVMGKGERAKRHLAAVTGMSLSDADKHVAKAFELWTRRNEIDWHLDLSLMTDNGIAIKPERNVEASQRRGIARERLQGHDGGEQTQD